jgi:hypothetical protein
MRFWPPSSVRGVETLSRLERGHTPNTTLDTLWRCAATVGEGLVLTAEEMPKTPAKGR